jgi:hypothetical protein
MSLPEPCGGDTAEVLVRHVPKSQRHPMIFARFDALAPSPDVG